MTRKQWKDLKGKLVHMTIIDVTPWKANLLTIECHIHEADDYFEFLVDVEEDSEWPQS